MVIWEAVAALARCLTVKSTDKNSGPVEQAARAVDVAPDGQKLALGRAAGVVVCDLPGQRALRDRQRSRRSRRCSTGTTD